MLLRAAAAPAGDGGPISGRRLPLLDPLAPAQTMPAPTREAKAEAARLMRAMERAWALRGEPSRPDVLPEVVDPSPDVQ